MRFVIKFFLKLHIKLRTWFHSWGEKESLAKGAHFSNALCNGMDKPDTLLPFLVGSLIGHEMLRKPGESWMPALWKFMYFVFIFVALLDLAISLIAFVYIVFLALIVIPFILLPLKESGYWQAPEKGTALLGQTTNSYLLGIWREVVAEHELYIANNMLACIHL